MGNTSGHTLTAAHLLNFKTLAAKRNTLEFVTMSEESLEDKIAKLEEELKAERKAKDKERRAKETAIAWAQLEAKEREKERKAREEERKAREEETQAKETVQRELERTKKVAMNLMASHGIKVPAGA